MSDFFTRFAPSPTGPLHLGHAYSAILAHDMARAAGGKFLLRIEDIDGSRARPEWETLIFEDLEWLGIHWDGPVMRQSERMAAYQSALDQLWRNGLLYPCTCNRRDILTAASAPQEGAPLIGPDGIVYPGTCRGTWEQDFPNASPRPADQALRLDMARACAEPGKPFARFGYYQEQAGGDQIIEFTPEDMETQIGDVALARKDMGTSYHLSVVLDDAEQSVTHVIRGEDLSEVTKIHVVLQSLLGLPKPVYHHHRLIRDDQGKRLAKRDDARAISKYREDGATPEDIREMVGLPLS